MLRQGSVGETGAARTAGRLLRAGRLGLPLDDLQDGRMGEADCHRDLAGGRAALHRGLDRGVALVLRLRAAAAAFTAASSFAWSPTFFSNAAGFALAAVAVLGFALAVVLRAGVFEVLLAIVLHLRGMPWARIGEQVGQRNLAVTANVYSHVLADERELDYAELLAA